MGQKGKNQWSRNANDPVKIQAMEHCRHHQDARKKN
jgi:hypothetical protein